MDHASGVTAWLVPRIHGSFQLLWDALSNLLRRNTYVHVVP